MNVLFLERVGPLPYGSLTGTGSHRLRPTADTGLTFYSTLEGAT